MKRSKPYTLEEYHYDCDEMNVRKVVWTFKGRQDNRVSLSCNKLLIMTFDLKDYGLTPFGWRLWPHVPDAET